MECSRALGEINILTTLYSVAIVYSNGPVGSVVCVYTLDHMSNDVTRVFSGDYLRRPTSNVTWQRVGNPNPFTVSIIDPLMTSLYPSHHTV